MISFTGRSGRSFFSSGRFSGWKEERTRSIVSTVLKFGVQNAVTASARSRVQMPPISVTPVRLSMSTISASFGSNNLPRSQAKNSAPSHEL